MKICAFARDHTLARRVGHRLSYEPKTGKNSRKDAKAQRSTERMAAADFADASNFAYLSADYLTLV